MANMKSARVRPKARRRKSTAAKPTPTRRVDQGALEHQSGEPFGSEWNEQMRRFIADASELSASEFLRFSTNPKNKARALAGFRMLARAYAGLMVEWVRIVTTVGVRMTLAVGKASLKSLGRR
jgi:hypothetical protein